MFRFICTLISLMLFSGMSAASAQTDYKNGAVILQYHHVSEKTPASTSVTPAQFREQMQYLANHDFNVVPLSEVVNAIKEKRSLPKNTVAITFDDGYKSIFNTARPILKEYGFPYTLFVAVEPINKHYRDMMSWKQLKVLTKEGAEIANHSWAHEYLIKREKGETESQWLKRVEDNILQTESTIAKETGQNLKMLAYPYGEYNAQIQNMLKQHGYVAFGQQSGAAGIYSDITALPRFPVAGPYADLDSLKVKMHSLTMPVLWQNITDPELNKNNFRPKLEVKIDTQDIYPHQLMCFIQGQGAQKPVWISDNEFTIQASLDLPVGRSRYNCTAPSKTQGRYYWFSQAWVRPKSDN